MSNLVKQTLLFFLLIASILMWRYFMHSQELLAQRLDSIGFHEHNLSDLFPCWWGAHELLLNGRDPYSPEVTREIQRGYYGRPLDHARPGDPVDEQRFAYPLYVVFILTPTIKLPFPMVKSFFTVLLFLAAVLTVVCWADVIGIRLGVHEVLSCILVALASIPYLEGIQIQQPSVLVALLLAGAAHTLIRERFLLAGFFLALSTIKPQLCACYIIYVLFWCVQRWSLRRRVVLSFFAVLAVLIAMSELCLPKWPLEFLTGLVPYMHYTQATTGVVALLGPVVGWLVLSGFTAAVGYWIWQMRSASIASENLRLSIALITTFTCIVIPSLAPHNQVLLVPGYLMLAKERKRVWLQGAIARSLWRAAWLVLAWPVVTGTLLVVALALGSARSRLWDLPFATNPLIPITLFVALLPLLVQQSAVTKSSVGDVESA